MTSARQPQQEPLEVLNRLKEQAKAEWISCDRGTEDSFAYIIDVLFPLAEMQMVHTSPTAPEPIPLCPRFGYVDCCPTKEQCPALHYCAEHYRRVDKSLIERDEAAKAAREQVLDAIQDHNDGRLGGMDILFATPANERTESAQGAYLKEAYFELTLVKHLIESLRAQQEQLARPIGTCPEGEPYYGQTILCNLKGDCKFKKEQRPFTPYGAPWYLCGREDAALALAEREQQKEAEAGK
jgi:hypothetical protein